LHHDGRKKSSAGLPQLGSVPGTRTTFE